MMLITLIILMVLILSVITLTVLSVGGAFGIIIFGDVIVCIAFLIFVIKKLIKKK